MEILGSRVLLGIFLAIFGFIYFWDNLGEARISSSTEKGDEHRWITVDCSGPTSGMSLRFVDAIT